MKKALSVIIAITLVCVVQIATGADFLQNTDADIPADVSRFYSDSNHAACFSTPAERSQLRLVAVTRQARDLSQRLWNVEKLIQRVDNRIARTDPGIIVKSSPVDPIQPVFTEPYKAIRKENTMTILVHV